MQHQHNFFNPTSRPCPLIVSSSMSGVEDTVCLSLVDHTTWILFLLAGNSQMLVTILFWALLYKVGVPTTQAVLGHGGVCVMVWVDGFLVNRIPVRVRTTRTDKLSTNRKGMIPPRRGPLLLVLD